MAGGVQSSVQTLPAPGIAGDRATLNPYYAFVAGPGGLVAGPAGLTVGLFAWTQPAGPVDADNAPTQVNNYGSGIPQGLVPRLQQGINVIYLSDASMFIPAGFEVSIMSAGDFWVVNNGTGQAYVGQKAYANFGSGKVSFAATGSPTNATGSASSIAAGTSSFTGSIAGNVLTVTGTVTGTIYPGTTISGTGVASGTKITQQRDGTTGGDGNYYVSLPEQTVASTTISGTYGTLTVGGTVAGTWAVGQTVTGTGISVTTTLTSLIPSTGGTGGAGTYIVDVNTVVNSTALTAATNVETSWYAQSSGAAGELIKISRLP